MITSTTQHVQFLHSLCTHKALLITTMSCHPQEEARNRLGRYYWSHFPGADSEAPKEQNSCKIKEKTNLGGGSGSARGIRKTFLSLEDRGFAQWWDLPYLPWSPGLPELPGPINMPNIYHSLIKNKYTQDICVFFTYLGLTKTNPVLLFQRKEFENMFHIYLLYF